MASKGFAIAGGVIDNGYRGELSVVITFTGQFEAVPGLLCGPVKQKEYKINKGDKIAQLVPIPVTDWPVEEVEEFEDTTKRGEGGFGSSGV